MVTTLVYIHGANATRTSWNYIRSKVKSQHECVLEYSSYNKFTDNLQDMLKEIHQFERVFFVGHSLGGIYAYHLASKLPFRSVGGISIASPFGGAGGAYFLSLIFPFYQLYKDIKPNSYPITHISSIKNVQRWTQVITTRGHNPMINGKNDGVVTIASQRQIDCEKVYMNESHNEILQSDNFAGLIIKRSGINIF
jgi:pimeloyl-ACP methyl ester carboxylesterase